MRVLITLMDDQVSHFQHLCSNFQVPVSPVPGEIMFSLDLGGPMHICGTHGLYHNNILKLKNKITLTKELIDNLSIRLDMAEGEVRKLEEV